MKPIDDSYIKRDVRKGHNYTREDLEKIRELYMAGFPLNVIGISLAIHRTSGAIYRQVHKMIAAGYLIHRGRLRCQLPPPKKGRWRPGGEQQVLEPIAEWYENGVLVQKYPAAWARGAYPKAFVNMQDYYV